MPGRPRDLLQRATQPFDLFGAEVAQQREPVQRKLQRLTRSGLSQQVVLGPFDRPVDVGEKPVVLKNTGKPRRSLGAAGQYKPEVYAARGKRCVEIAEDAGAGKIDVGDAPQLQQQHGRSLARLAARELRAPRGASAERRA